MIINVEKFREKISHPAYKITTKFSGVTITTEAINYGDKYSANSIGLIFDKGGSVFFSGEYIDNFQHIFTDEVLISIKKFLELVKIELEILNQELHPSVEK